MVAGRIGHKTGESPLAKASPATGVNSTWVLSASRLVPVTVTVKALPLGPSVGYTLETAGDGMSTQAIAVINMVTDGMYEYDEPAM